MKRKTSIESLILMSFLSLGMHSCSDSTAENSLEMGMMEPDESGVEISKEEIFNLIESSSTPVEMALVIKNVDYEFSVDILLPTDNTEKYNTSYEKAYAMGAYGADIGFLNIYNKLHVLPDYLMMTRNLAKGLDLDSFFDFQTLLDLSNNIENVDMLIQMSTESFNKMEAHLRDQGRDEISLLIVFGTWLEGTYVLADFADKFNDSNMMDRVAEQKNFVIELNRIFEASTDKYFQLLSEKIQPLANLYKQVEIEEILNEPTIEEKDGQIIIIDNSEVKIHAKDGVLKSITKEIKSLRNNLLK